MVDISGLSDYLPAKADINVRLINIFIFVLISKIIYQKVTYYLNSRFLPSPMVSHFLNRGPPECYPG